MTKQTYPLSYVVRQEHPPKTGPELLKLYGGDVGGCDAVVILSMIYPPDGSFSLQVVSLDGRTNDDVPDEQLFKVWSLLAKRLADSKTLGEGKRGLAATTFECLRTAVLSGRASPLT